MRIEKEKAHNSPVDDDRFTRGSICDEIVEGRLLATASSRQHESACQKQTTAIGESANEGILERIRHLLRTANVQFQEVEHKATYTSEESAKARGEDLSVGAKALLVKTDDEFRLFVLPADRKLDSAAVKREFRAKKVRFATAEELKELTGLVPGCVPPFGEPILPFKLYADVLVGATVDKVAFNAGSLTHSIIMKASDWDAVAKTRRLRFSK